MECRNLLGLNRRAGGKIKNQACFTNKNGGANSGLRRMTKTDFFTEARLSSAAVYFVGFVFLLRRASFFYCLVTLSFSAYGTAGSTAMIPQLAEAAPIGLESLTTRTLRSGGRCADFVESRSSRNKIISRTIHQKTAEWDSGLDSDDELQRENFIDAAVSLNARKPSIDVADGGSSRGNKLFRFVLFATKLIKFLNFLQDHDSGAETGDDSVNISEASDASGCGTELTSKSVVEGLKYSGNTPSYSPSNPFEWSVVTYENETNKGRKNRGAQTEGGESESNGTPSNAAEQLKPLDLQRGESIISTLTTASSYTDAKSSFSQEDSEVSLQNSMEGSLFSESGTSTSKAEMRSDASDFSGESDDQSSLKYDPRTSSRASSVVLPKEDDIEIITEREMLDKPAYRREQYDDSRTGTFYTCIPLPHSCNNNNYNHNNGGINDNRPFGSRLRRQMSSLHYQLICSGDLKRFILTVLYNILNVCNMFEFYLYYKGKPVTVSPLGSLPSPSPSGSEKTSGLKVKQMKFNKFHITAMSIVSTALVCGMAFLMHDYKELMQQVYAWFGMGAVPIGALFGFFFHWYKSKRQRHNPHPFKYVATIALACTTYFTPYLLHLAVDRGKSLPPGSQYYILYAISAVLSLLNAHGIFVSIDEIFLKVSYSFLTSFVAAFFLPYFVEVTTMGEPLKKQGYLTYACAIVAVGLPIILRVVRGFEIQRLYLNKRRVINNANNSVHRAVLAGAAWKQGIKSRACRTGRQQGGNGEENSDVEEPRVSQNDTTTPSSSDIYFQSARSSLS